MARVFLSYAREDADRVHQLADALAHSGHQVWWDHHIHGGSRYAEEIDRALYDSDAVVVLWSPPAVSSTWVLDEAAEGRDAGKLVPALLRRCKPPLGYRQFQTVDLLVWDGNTPAPGPLLAAIAKTAGNERYQIKLMGDFRLCTRRGERLNVRSKKAIALVAMLAMAEGGERTREWLEDRLWGSRGRVQARECLARQLARIRKILAGHHPLIETDYDCVRIDLKCSDVDALKLLDEHSSTVARGHGEFLEGLSIEGEPGFEAWLREQRAAFRAQAALSRTNKPKSASARTPAATSALRTRLIIDQQGRAQADEDLADLCARAETDLVDRLARLRWLSVVERDEHADEPSDEEPDYALHLDVSRGHTEAWLTIKLVRRSSARVLLSRRVDLADDGSFTPEAMRELVAAIDNQIETAEQQRALRKTLSDLAPYEIIWRARWHLDRLTAEDATIAQQLVEPLLGDAPGWAEALIQSGFIKGWSIWASRGSEREILALRSLGAKAVAADKFDARGHLLIGMADTWLRQPRRACLALKEAISLNPSLCQAYMQLGSALYLSGDAEGAVEPMETALLLNPRDTQAFCVLAERGMVYLMLNDWNRAVQSTELALLRRPGYWYAHVIKINALARMGDTLGAQRAHAELMRAKPRFSHGYLYWLPFLDERWPRALEEGLEQAERTLVREPLRPEQG